MLSSYEPSTSLDDRGENYSSLLQCHLILFIGKKCSNKTLQYHRYFSASHERVSLDEWSKREKLSLHAMFKKVIKKLEKQCKIVIDDENLIAETRKSLLEKVKHCIPQCKVGALYFTCNNERVLEYQFNLNQILSYFLKKNHIKSPDVCLTGHPLLQHSQDTSKEQIIPSKTEGFDIVMESKVKLTIVNREKVEFNHQGLIVDGLLLALRLLVLSPSQEKDISNFADPHIHWLFTQWIKVKPNGRIIIVLIQKDYEKLCDLLGKKTKTFEQFVMWVERTCCKYFTFPIFTVEIKMMSSTQQMKRDEILLLSSLLYLHSLAISEAIVIVSPFNAQSMLHLGNSSIVNQHKKFFTTECRSDKNHLYINNEMYTSMAKLGLILVDFSSFLDITTQELDSDETLRIEQKIALIQLDYRSNQAEFLKHIEFVQIDSWKSNGEWFSKYIGRYPFISELQKSNRSEFRAGIFQDSQQREINHILFGIICNPSVIAQFASQNDFSNHLQFYQKINEYSVSNQMNMNMESINAERKRFSPKQTEKLSKGIEGSPSGGNLMRKQISMVMPNTSHQ
ncbi:hypothetical protein C9374_012405 [Naegleria lovaniensis]|uniref:Uncharacterized protein n=1 Tax=Naegleria lovaniensis TaxID=51637 RepID=A0AA88KNI8_NAELO|nr:uncharacterized protein C9374_012405 [Naegleria lovaniensis]KAG2392153.1 hypothetical protein C9374_012405 [Naegleria lovaniensis]